MPGANRRNRRLQQTTDLTSIGEFSSVNPQDGDILIFDFAAGAYENGRDLIGDYSISGTLTASDLLVTDDVTIQDALNVTGNTGLTGDLAVIGITTLNGNATAAGTLGVTGVVTLSDALSVAGALTGSGFSFTDDGTITGTLGVTGLSTLASASIGTLAVTGDSALAGFLSVDGITQFNDEVTVNGPLGATSLAADNISAGGNLSVTGVFSWGGGNLSEDLIDNTLASTLISALFTITGRAADFSTLDMLTLDPDAHHILGGVDGVIVPVGTTAEEPAGVDGMIRYDSDTTKFRAFENSVWVDIITTPSVALDDVTDVTLTTPATGDILYKSAGDWLNTNAIVIDPAGEVQLKFNTTLALSTVTAGIAARTSSGSNAQVQGFSSAGVKSGQIQFDNASFGLVIQSNLDSNFITIGGADAGSAFVVCADFDPDGAVRLNFDDTLEFATKSGGVLVSNELEVDGAFNHDGSTFGIYGTTPTAQSAAYTINATAAPSRTLLASASATTLNNNNVLAALIADLQLTGILG